MISITDNKSWKNKIILSPNGTGKTRLCRRLFKENSNKTKFFSQESINDLVQVDSSNIYVGTSSKYQKLNQSILETIRKSNFFKTFIEKEYSVTKIKDLKEKSLFFRNLEITNKDSDSLFIKLLDMDFCYIYENDISILKTDVSFDPELVNLIDSQICNITEYDLNDIKIEDNTNLIYLPKEVLNKVEELINYMKVSEFNKCILCGNDNKQLYNQIEKTFLTYTSNETIPRIIDDLYRRYKTITGDKSSSSTFEKYLKLKAYRDFSKNSNKKVLNYILSININGKSLFEYLTEYHKNQEIIDDSRKRENIQDNYQKIIIDEFEKLVTIPNEVKVYFDENGILKVKTEESNIISEILSSSEIKRLGLAVLNAEITTSTIEYIIFDDPVDSYDDYYIKIASDYIARIIQSKNIDFTIVTHLYDFCYYLSYSLPQNEKFNYTLYYYDPNYTYDGNKKDCKLLHIGLTKDDIQQINQNELLLFHSLVVNPDLDRKFILLSMCNTLRSLIYDINRDIQNVNYSDSSIQPKMNRVQANYLHYGKKEILFEELNEIAVKLINDTKSIKSKGEKCVDLRTNYLEEKITKINITNRGVLIILYKMLRMQKCKYEIEKLIINILKELKVEDKKIKTIIGTSTISNRINLAMSYAEDNRLNKIKEIYDKYFILINEFSHSFTRLISPYLMTSVIDIAKLEYEISII